MWVDESHIPGPGSSDAPQLAELEDLPEVVRLHARALPDSFLASLGTSFLTRLYGRIVRSPGAFLLVTTDTGGLTGFVAVATDTNRLYREFLLHDGVAASFGALAHLLRHPRKVIETLRYGTGDTVDLPAAEVLSTAVAARARGRGVGTRLVLSALAELDRRGHASARVVTASDNQAAIIMYERAGFETRATVEVHRGITQQVLVWH